MATTVNRLTGMYSGLDTDALVKSLVSGQQAKIDKLVQQKQKAEWKIAAYNDFNTKLKAFRENFGSAVGANSLMSKSTYNDYTVNIPENNSIKVVATSSAKAGSYNVVVNNIATATTAKSGKLSASAGGLNATALKSTSIGSLTQLARGAFNTTNSEFSFSINGEDFTFSTDDSLQTVMDKVNASDAGVTMSYSQVDDRITISSKQLGEYKGLQNPGEAPTAPGSFAGVKPVQDDYSSQAAYEKDLADYNSAYDYYQKAVMNPYKDELASWKNAKEAYDSDQKKAIDLEDPNGFFSHLGIGAVTAGREASVTINGEDFSLSENTVTLDGVQMTFVRPTELGGIDFDLTRSTDKAMETIKKFVEEFNTMVGEIYGANTQKVASDYYPLTDDMKAEMSEAEIEKWEEKAKEGLLYRDSSLDKLYTGLRGLLSKNFGTVGRLSSIGITSGSYMIATGFELQIDEEKLRAALENNPDGVYELFSLAATDTDSGGFMTQVNKLMDNFTGSTKSREITNLNNNINTYDKSIKEQEDKLTIMSERYYLQYAELETALGKMQTQQDSLSSLLGVGSAQ